jgi:hypothetical protein
VTLSIHRKVFSDVERIMSYYESVDSPDLADEFYDEFMFCVRKALRNPEAYPIKKSELRRMNFERFSLSSLVSPP